MDAQRAKGKPTDKPNLIISDALQVNIASLRMKHLQALFTQTSRHQAFWWPSMLLRQPTSSKGWTVALVPVWHMTWIFSTLPPLPLVLLGVLGEAEQVL